ncbi:MAG: nucleoside-diphosphate kinase [Patescibacteria group bacterium]
MEKTVVLIKPDGMKKKIVGKIIDRFERSGLELVGLKLINLTQEMLNDWYSHHKDKPFFSDLAHFMRETPVVAMVLMGENAVSRVREIIGPTDSTKAMKGTIRGDFGDDVQRNVVHASDAAERAKFEIKMLFKTQEIFT